MLVTEDPALADLARMLRAHGWTRDVKRKPKIVDAPIDERFLFVNLGYNFRPMETQGAFGLHQVAKLEPFIKTRRDNVEYWNAALRRHDRWLRACPGRDTNGSRSVWFGYPISVRPQAPFSRDELARFPGGQADRDAADHGRQLPGSAGHPAVPAPHRRPAAQRGAGHAPVALHRQPPRHQRARPRVRRRVHRRVHGAMVVRAAVAHEARLGPWA